jgi:hypothetical protein
MVQHGDKAILSSKTEVACHNLLTRSGDSHPSHDEEKIRKQCLLSLPQGWQSVPFHTHSSMKK